MLLLWITAVSYSYNDIKLHDRICGLSNVWSATVSEMLRICNWKIEQPDPRPLRFVCFWNVDIIVSPYLKAMLISTSSNPRCKSGDFGVVQQVGTFTRLSIIALSMRLWVPPNVLDPPETASRA